jgi:hypothetical protein
VIKPLSRDSDTLAVEQQQQKLLQQQQQLQHQQLPQQKQKQQQEQQKQKEKKQQEQQQQQEQQKQQHQRLQQQEQQQQQQQPLTSSYSSSITTKNQTPQALSKNQVSLRERQSSFINNSNISAAHYSRENEKQISISQIRREEKDVINKEVGDLLIKHPVNRSREERVLQKVIENNKNEEISIDSDKKPLPGVNLATGIVNANTAVETAEAPTPTVSSLPVARVETTQVNSSETNKVSMSETKAGFEPATTTTMDQPALNPVLLKTRPSITRKKEAPSNSMVFNFLNCEKVVTHIENDGLDMSKRRSVNTKVRCFLSHDTQLPFNLPQPLLLTQLKKILQLYFCLFNQNFAIHF